ncbi:hypothetical protein [Nocardioides pantholopis]|uniref:hypothetical protein n=1 Tax=Nocardioides pantholopis TaxID=2483798 RepID=UPI000FDB109E|nr:hypothetical protein [Nocardioides pantholopis]
MTYDLAVWEGPRPESDESAAICFAQLLDRPESDPHATADPTPAIRAYVDALLARWPDITEDAGEDSPWADGPLIGNASGSSIHFSLVWSAAEEASEFAARLAHDHGLVCYDPQREALRPPPARASTRPTRRSWFRRNP